MAYDKRDWSGLANPNIWSRVARPIRQRLYRRAKELGEDPAEIIESALLYWLDANSAAMTDPEGAERFTEQTKKVSTR